MTVVTPQEEWTTRPASTHGGRRTTSDGQRTATDARSTIMIAITTTQPASAGSLKQVIIRHPLVAFFVLAAEDMPHYLIAHLNDGRY
jgi:hypothetical protein